MQQLLNKNYAIVQMLDQMVREHGFENEQWFLDWQDRLNEISVK